MVKGLREMAESLRGMVGEGKMERKRGNEEKVRVRVKAYG